MHGNQFTIYNIDNMVPYDDDDNECLTVQATQIYKCNTTSLLHAVLLVLSQNIQMDPNANMTCSLCHINLWKHSEQE